MIAAIIIIGLAFGWLLGETDYLRVRLLCGVYVQLDYELNYDASDHCYLTDYELQLEEAIKNAEYQAWLDEYHAPKIIYGNRYNVDQIDPRDKWMADREKLTARRNGEMIYQRIRG